MKHAAAFLLFFAALWWLWQLLAGEWNQYEWIAGAGAAAVGAAIGEIARTRARARGSIAWSLVASIPSALGMVVVDFAVVVRALATRRSGSFHQSQTAVAGRQQSRAWGAYLASLSPNAYVLEIDRESKVVLTHHLVHRPKSQAPV